MWRSLRRKVGNVARYVGVKVGGKVGSWEVDVDNCLHGLHRFRFCGGQRFAGS